MKKPGKPAKQQSGPVHSAKGAPAHKGAVVTSKITKAKPAKHVSAKVKAARHAAAVKASHTRAANAKKARQKQPKLALGSAVACCSAEAVAASLRLAGWPVTDGDVLALYLRTTRDLDAGAPIVATLEAAAEYGLAGVRPVSFQPVCVYAYSPDVYTYGLILSLNLPAAHAVLDTGYEWISWGEAWPAAAFPDAALMEAWTVEWEHHRMAPRCLHCLDTGHVCEDHPDYPWDGLSGPVEGHNCQAPGMPCGYCCPEIPEDGTRSIVEAFTPGWQRAG